MLLPVSSPDVCPYTHHKSGDLLHRCSRDLNLPFSCETVVNIFPSEQCNCAPSDQIPVLCLHLTCLSCDLRSKIACFRMPNAYIRLYAWSDARKLIPERHVAGLDQSSDEHAFIGQYPTTGFALHVAETE